MRVAVEVAVAVILPIVGAIVGAWAWEGLIRPRLAMRPARRLLGLNESRQTVLVFPTREIPEERLSPLSAVTWEDTMAVEHLRRSVASAGLSVDHLHPAESFNLADRLNCNVLVVGSQKRNEVCERVLAQIRRQYRVNWSFGLRPGSSLRWQLVFEEDVFESPSYDQARRAMQDGSLSATTELCDFALVARAPTSSSSERSGVAVIAAGLRGIGTWGAAKFIDEEAKVLNRLANSAGFGVVLRVTFAEWCIADVEVVASKVLSRP